MSTFQLSVASLVTAFASLTGPRDDIHQRTDISPRIFHHTNGGQLPQHLAELVENYPIAAYNLFVDSRLGAPNLFRAAPVCQSSIEKLFERYAALKEQSLTELAVLDSIAQSLTTSSSPNLSRLDSKSRPTLTTLKAIIDMGGVDEGFHRSVGEALERADVRAVQRLVHQKLAEIFPEKLGPYSGGSLPKTELRPLDFLIGAEEALSRAVNETTRSAAMIALATVCEQLYPGTCLGRTRSDLVFGDRSDQIRVTAMIRKLMMDDERLR